MRSPDDRQAFWDIRTCLLSSADCAESFARTRPEHLDAVTRFVQEIRRLKDELMESFRDDWIDAPLHDIVNGLTIARGMASLMAERHPDQQAFLTRFEDGLRQAHEIFIRKVQPQAYGRTESRDEAPN
jgi:hypothetical protein